MASFSNQVVVESFNCLMPGLTAKKDEVGWLRLVCASALRGDDT